MQILSKVPTYVWTFIIGFVIALLIDGCGTSEPEIITVEKLVPKIEYVDRYKTDTVRFAQWTVKRDTVIVNDNTIDVRLDTLLKVDTLKIIDTWLTEIAKYDTTLEFSGGFVNVKWQNYQNLSEHLEVTLMPKKGVNLKRVGVLMYAKGGIRSDFKSIYTPVVGGGLLIERKNFIFGADYGYSGQHNINGVVGYRLR